MLELAAGLLQDLGFGLDLSKCAATGALDDLVYVSPRTGRAVSREAGAVPSPVADAMTALEWLEGELPSLDGAVRE